MSFFLPFLYLVIFIRLKFHETTEAFKNPPIIPSPIFLFYSRRILNFEISKLDQKKKKDVQNFHLPGRHFSSASSSPFSKFERNTMKKIPLLDTIVVPTIFEIISLSSLFFPFFFRKSVAVSAIISKKNHRRFHPPPEVRVSFARDASLEAHIPSPQCSFWNLTSAKGA